LSWQVGASRQELLFLRVEMAVRASKLATTPGLTKQGLTTAGLTTQGLIPKARSGRSAISLEDLQ